MVGEDLLLLAQRLRRDLLRVAAGGLRVARVDGDIDELGAEAFDLLLDHGPRVVGLDDRAQTAGGRDGLETGHARADDQHLGRDDRAGGGGEHREELRQGVGGHEDGLVAGDGGLRGEDVHRLGAGRARDGVHAERRDVSRGELTDQIDVCHGLQERDDGRAGAEQSSLVCVRLLHFDDDLSIERLGGVGDDGGAGGDVGVVAVSRGQTRATFHLDDDTAGREPLDRVGCHRDASLAGSGLARHADDQRACRLAFHNPYLPRASDYPNRWHSPVFCDKTPR